MVHDKVVFITVRTSPYIDKVLNQQSPDEINPETNKSWYIHENDIEKLLMDSIGYTDLQISYEQYLAMKDGNLPYKFNRFQQCVSSFRTMWKPIDIKNNYTTDGYRFDGKWSLKHNLAVGLSFGILLLFLPFGLFILYKKNHFIFYVFSTIIVVHTLFHVLYIPYTRNRYRNPIDGIIIICGVLAIYSLSVNLKHFFNRKINAA
jgi:hypothetical protein